MTNAKKAVKPKPKPPAPAARAPKPGGAGLGFNKLYLIIPIIAAVVVVVIVLFIFVMPGMGGGAPAKGQIASGLIDVRSSVANVGASASSLLGAVQSGDDTSAKTEEFGSGIDDYLTKTSGLNDGLAAYSDECQVEDLIEGLNTYDFALAATLFYLEAYNEGDPTIESELESLLSMIGEAGELEAGIAQVADCLSN
jgi:hypothetical protein